MKKLLLPCFLSAIFLIGFADFAKNANAQSTSTLIHYWYFPEFATQTYTEPNVPFVYEDYDVSGDTSVAYLEYYLIPGTSNTFGSGNGSDNLDGVACVDSSVADGGNARNGVGPDGWALRVRNPVDSIELRWHMPTTGYSNPVITYALESSSTTSGDSTQIYSYSNNGGATWNTAAIWVNGVSVDTLDVTQTQYQGSSWGLVVITFVGDDSVNNNPNFIFRITYRGNTAKESGNNRFADVTMDGGGSGGSKPPPAKVTVSAPASGNILVPGQQVTVSFATQNLVDQACTIQFSSNGGTSWSPVGQVTGTSYVWTVPDVATEQGEIEVTDSGVSGTSTPFVIYPITPTNLIVHYWDFNTIGQAYHIPNIPPLPADFSATSQQGTIIYDTLPGTSNSNLGYLDNVDGDTTTANDDALFGEPAGQALRVRNPTDSMDLRFVIPTTNYQGITLKYSLQSSSLTGPQREFFAYNSQGFWTSAGLTVNGVVQDSLDVTDTQYQGAANGQFGLVTIGFGTETSMDNNPNFQFRITFGDTATGGTSGNNRIDNFSVTAQSQIVNSVNEPAQADNQLQLTPNPATDYVSFENPYSSSVTVSVLNVLGQEVLHSDGSASSNVELNTSTLPAGTYYIHVQNVTSGASQIAKFVKQ